MRYREWPSSPNSFFNTARLRPSKPLNTHTHTYLPSAQEIERLHAEGDGLCVRWPFCPLEAKHVITEYCRELYRCPVLHVAIRTNIATANAFGAAACIQWIVVRPDQVVDNLARYRGRSVLQTGEQGWVG